MRARADVPCKHSLRLSEKLDAIWKTVEGKKKKKNSSCLYDWRFSSAPRPSIQLHNNSAGFFIKQLHSTLGFKQ